MRTRTLTVVFTDMADYTRSVSASDREGLRTLLAMHEQLVGPVLTRRGGRVVKNIGDSFMALFESATDALRACLDLMEAHAPANATGIAFRAGLATGDVEDTGNDAFGEPVNLAARIIGKTPTGEVWFSNATRHCMNQAEIPYESTGRHALKGIPGDIEVFRAVPRHAAYLPDDLVAAIRARAVVRWAAGDPVPRVPQGAHVVLHGYRAGTSELAGAVDQLPQVEPARLWLATYAISPADRHDWARGGRQLLVATVEGLDAAFKAHERAPTRTPGSDTIIMDGDSDAAFDLVAGGLALPSVPLAEVVAGYSYDLLSDGRWLNRHERAVLRVEVGMEGASALVLGPGVQVGGQAAAVDTRVALVDGLRIRTPSGAMTYRALNTEGYLGVLLGEGVMRLGVAAGQAVEIGREPQQPGYLLPDRSNQDNIAWLAGPRAARARERGLTVDKVMTGRRQASVADAGGTPVVTPLHETCASVLLGADGGATRLAAATDARIGDSLLLGTSVVALRPPVG